MSGSGLAPPPFVRMAAHDLRWRLLCELAGGDYRVRELVQLVGHPQNLVSYHLRLLRDAALVSSRRSSFDARDTYYHLDLDRCASLLAAFATGQRLGRRRILQIAFRVIGRICGGVWGLCASFG